MKRSNKILLGAGTAFAHLVTLLFGAVVFLLLFGGGPHGGAFPIFQFFPLLLLIQLLMLLLSLGLTVFYIVHVIKNDLLTNQMKAIWSIAIFLGGPIGTAVYWYIQIWKGPSELIDLP